MFWNSSKCFWTLENVGKSVFGFYEAFGIQGKVFMDSVTYLGFWEAFWIIGKVFLDSRKGFLDCRSALDPGKGVYGFWEAFGF